MFNFLTLILDCNSRILDFFLFSDPNICSTVVFPPLENSDDVVVSVSIDILSNKKGDVLFHGTVYEYSCTDWKSIHDHLRDVLWGAVVKLGASAAGTELCEWLQVGIDVYIPHRRYQNKPHSFPWFSPACATTIAH